MPQVHIIDTPIYDKRYCFLVAVRVLPNADDVESILKSLRGTLRLPHSTRALVSTPFRKTPGDTWFRADGDLHRSFKDLVLQPRIRAAISALRSPSLSDNTGSIDNIMVHLTGFPVNRQPFLWALYLRQSNEDGGRAKDSMPRQLATLLTSPLLDAVQPQDHVAVFAEICSSSKHPLSDRRLFQAMQRDRPIQILTVNPDRLTRRSEEVDMILARVQATGGHWFTQGFPHSEEGCAEDWHAVSQENADDLKTRLKLGKLLRLSVDGWCAN